jgi:hypothetical protein
LYKAGYLSRYEQNSKLTFAKAPEVLPDLDVYVTVSPTHDTWSIAIHDQGKEHGPYSIFSDSSGVIYPAQPLP